MERLKITNSIRLIELFAGVGSQAMALRNIGANFEKYLICEWWVQAFASYKAIHFGEDETDYSEGISKMELIDILFKYGISNDGKDPMTLEQIQKKPEKWLRDTYNNIKATNNIVNIMAAAGSRILQYRPCIGGYWPNKRDRTGEIGADSFGNGSSRSKRDGSRRPGCLRT